jgi:hypothetical protein
VVVGSFSAVTAVVYMVPFVMQIHVLFVWDALLFFFWVVLFGIFGNVSSHLVNLSQLPASYHAQ